MLNTARAADDLTMFVSYSLEAMASTPHLYASALSWVPKRSYIATSILPTHMSQPIVTEGSQDEWDSTLWTKSYQSAILSVFYSPDGRQIMGCTSSRVYIWSSETGREVGQLDIPSLRRLAYSPDGRRIATLASGFLSLWDPVTCEAVGEAIEAEALAFDFFPDLSNRLVTGSHGGELQMWDLTTSRAIGGPIRAHSGGVRSISISPDSTRIASGAWNKTVRLCNARTGEFIGELIDSHSEPLIIVRFSPDGTRFASRSKSELGVWSAQTGEAMGDMLKLGDGHACIAWLSDSRRIAYSNEAVVEVLDTETGAKISLEAHTGDVLSLAAPDRPYEKQLMSASGDGTLIMWNIKEARAYRSLYGHSESVSCIASSPDFRQIVSCSNDKTIRVWDILRHPIANNFDSTVNATAITSASYCPDGKHIITCSDRGVCLRDVETGRLIKKYGTTEGASLVIYSPDSLHFATVSENSALIWDSRTGSTICTLKGHDEEVLCIAFSKDGKFAVTGSFDKTARVWNVATGEPVGRPLLGHTQRIVTVAFSPSGRCIVSGSTDCTVRLWDSQTGMPMGKTLEHSSWIEAATFSPDGKYAAFGAGDSTGINRIDTFTGDRVPSMVPHLGVCCLAYSHDGAHIAIGTSDGHIAILDAPSGEVIRTVQNYFHVVKSVEFSPDDSCILSTSFDDTLAVSLLLGPERTEWHDRCLLMDLDDGWVKDTNGSLLLWIPPRYRHSVRNNIILRLGENIQERKMPTIDWSRLQKCVGSEWVTAFGGGTG